MSNSPPSAANIVGSFQVTGWEETVYEDPEDGPKLTRGTVKKTFAGGLEGESSAELLTAQGETGRGYLASERFVGVIGGREGTIVFQHGGLADETSTVAFGNIVPGSGTGELEGLSGTVTFSHDASGATVTVVLA